MNNKHHTIKNHKKFYGLSSGGFHIHCTDWDLSGNHDHEFLEFVYVARGAINHHFGDLTERIETGGYFIVDHKNQHSMERVSEEKLWIINFLFFPEFIDRTLAGKTDFNEILNSYLLKFSYRTLKGSVTGRVFYDTDGSVRTVVDDIIHEIENKNYGYLELIRCQFTRILINMMREVGKNDVNTEYSEIVNSLISIVHRRYSEKLRLNDIAKELGYSNGYLSAAFSKSVGCPFYEYLQRIRIENACRLLVDTTFTVAQIAEQVGMNDIKFFNKIFKKRLELTPTQFRKLHN